MTPLYFWLVYVGIGITDDTCVHRPLPLVDAVAVPDSFLHRCPFVFRELVNSTFFCTGPSLGRFLRTPASLWCVPGRRPRVNLSFPELAVIFWPRQLPSVALSGTGAPPHPRGTRLWPWPWLAFRQGLGFLGIFVGALGAARWTPPRLTFRGTADSINL